jgi:hypothetical protein
MNFFLVKQLTKKKVKKKISNIFFIKLAFYGLDVELEPELEP